MPGTYNISAQMAANGNVVGAFQIDGGTVANPTMYAACDASGNYLGAAGYNAGTGMTGSIITVKTSGGAYNAGQNYPKNGPILAHISPAHLSHIVVDGLTFTGGAYKGIRVGGASSGDGPNGVTGVLIQNCVFTDFSAIGLGNDNFGMVWMDGYIDTSPVIVQNNYFHDNLSSVVNSADHLEAVFSFGKAGAGSAPAQGIIVQNNTVIRSGGVWYGKIDNIERSTVQYNYCDASGYTSIATIGAIYDGSGNLEAAGSLPNPPETGTNLYHHNVLLTSGMHGIGRNAVNENLGYTTPMQVYNNTIVMGASGSQVAFWVNGMSTAPGGLKAYNNVYTGSADGQGNGCFVTTPQFPAVIDYNMYLASGMNWALRNNSSPGTLIAKYTTTATFAAALAANGGISGAEAHSVLATPSFVGSGSQVAQHYQLVAGSSGSATSANPGSTTGTTGGAACDKGAWGNLPVGVSIGCSFGP